MRSAVGGLLFGLGAANVSREMMNDSETRTKPPRACADDRTQAMIAPATAKATPTQSATTTRLISVSLPS